MRTHPVPLSTDEPVPSSRVAPTLRSLGFRYLHVIDAATLYALMIAITVVRFGFDWPTFPRSHYFAGFAFATAIHMTVYYFGGLYEYEQRLGRPPWLPRASMLTFLAVLADASVALLTGRYLMPRANLAVLLVAASMVVTLNRWLARSLRSRRFGRPRILLVGAPDDIELARSHLAESEPGALVVGQTDRPSEILNQIDGVHATDVLLLSGGSLDQVYPQPLGVLERRLIGVYRRITPADTLLGLQRSRQIGGMPFVALRAHAVPMCRLRFKRVLDLLYLLIGVILIVPITALVAVYVRIRAGTGVLYRQARVGRNGRTFTMLKFRTMHHGAEDTTGAVMADRDDRRVVNGLAWIRRARLDELPQLWNVARGEMSLVGPRPERPEFVASFEAVIPGYGRRHDTPPGITGLAQIHGHYQTDPGYKLGHDLQYVVNWSPIYDLEIMAETVVTMFRRTAR
jgi:lipopolysaccharide/colanic/teichoic acid biosynthesis glycosyltransferase